MDGDNQNTNTNGKKRRRKRAARKTRADLANRAAEAEEEQARRHQADARRQRHAVSQPSSLGLINVPVLPNDAHTYMYTPSTSSPFNPAVQPREPEFLKDESAAPFHYALVTTANADADAIASSSTVMYTPEADGDNDDASPGSPDGFSVQLEGFAHGYNVGLQDGYEKCLEEHRSRIQAARNRIEVALASTIASLSNEYLPSPTTSTLSSSSFSSPSSSSTTSSLLPRPAYLSPASDNVDIELDLEDHFKQFICADDMQGRTLKPRAKGARH